MGQPQVSLPQIFLAEDNPGDVRSIREALKVHDVKCQLKVVDDGKEAMELVAMWVQAAVRPALILLDLNLPKRDGLDILRLIKETPAVRQVPVVILSSSESPGDLAQTVLLGADRYIRKPSTLDEFMEIGAIAKELIPQP